MRFIIGSIFMAIITLIVLITMTLIRSSLIYVIWNYIISPVLNLNKISFALSIGFTLIISIGLAIEDLIHS